MVYCRTLSTVKLVARKRRVYKYACKQSFGNKFCFENFKAAEFLSLGQGPVQGHFPVEGAV